MPILDLRKLCTTERGWLVRGIALDLAFFVRRIFIGVFEFSLEWVKFLEPVCFGSCADVFSKKTIVSVFYNVISDNLMTILNGRRRPRGESCPET